MLDVEDVEERVYTLDYKKKLERLNRDKNLLILENKRLINKIANYEKENKYLNKRNETLTALEKSIPVRIEAYKSKNAPEYLIKELELWQDMLSFELEKTLESNEVEDE